MKPVAAVVVLLFILGSGAPVQAQNVVGPIYLASLYGLICDDATDDTTALIALVNTVHTNGGGTIVLPSTGTWCLIGMSFDNSGHGWWANVNLQGCGMYGSNQSTMPTTPPCGLDLQYKDSTAKMSFTTYGQTIFRDLAIVDNNATECSGALTGWPFFFVTKTVVHFQNVSIQGSSERLSACNDAFTLGGTGVCQPDNCFLGYGSTFQNLFFSHVRRIALFNSDVNGTDWDYIFGDTYNGNSSNGTSPTGSAIEINCITGQSCYANVFKNIALEQGPPSGSVSLYKYGFDVIANAGSNFIFGISCSDHKSDVSACVHIASTSGTNVIDPQMVLGCYPVYTPGYSGFPSCVGRDSLGSYRDLVIDPSIMSMFAQTVYGANLGMASNPFNYLYLGIYLSLESGSYIYGNEGGAPSGVPSVDLLWPDSTDHRWKMWNNNAASGAVDVAGVSGATTANDCAKFDSHGTLVDAAVGCNVQRISCVQTNVSGTLSTFNTYYYCNSDLQTATASVAGTPTGAACTLTSVYMAVMNAGTVDSGSHNYTVGLGTLSAPGGTFSLLTGASATLATNSTAASQTVIGLSDSLSAGALLAVRITPPGSFGTAPVGVQFSVVAFCQ